MKKLIYLFTLVLSFFVITMSVNAQNVNVTATGGPSLADTYTTLKAAFDSINVGRHTGVITIIIKLSTIETATAELFASGTGASSYTSISITPSAVATVQGTIVGAIVKLTGADNVRLDGRIGGVGIIRHLTIRNNSNATATAAIWLSSGTDSAGARKNTVTWCELSCNARQDSTSALSSFGIVSQGTTITSPTSSDGTNNDSNSVIQNRIIRCRWGINFRGAAANTNEGNSIRSNIVGPTSFGPDQIGKTGILAVFQTNCLITQNLVQFVGGTFATTPGGSDRCGIGAGSESWDFTPTNTAGSNYTITRNKIHDINEERTFSALGIVVTTTLSGLPTNNLIANNEIYNVRANGTGGDAGVGIGHNGVNSNDLVVYNSIFMFGDIDPPGTSTATRTNCGIRVATLADSITTVKNNSIYVDLTSNTAGLLHVCIQMPDSTYKFGTAEMDNNDYFTGAIPLSPSPQMRVGALGTTSAPTRFYIVLAQWQATFTPVAQDANSISADPVYALAPPNFLIPLDGTSPLLLEADPIAGITIDILGESRSLTTPTIGAYEFTATTLPVELSALNATVRDRDVILNWTTVSEINNAGFDIERKSVVNPEISGWTKVGNVAGNGTSTTPHNYSFIDRGLNPGKYNYRLKQIDFNGNFEYFNLSYEIGVGIPTKFDLAQNYPNPFNPSTKINYDLPFDGKVSIKLYDISGREVATLVNDVQTAGYYTINFNGSNLASGLYFYTLTSTNFVATKKMMLVK